MSEPIVARPFSPKGRILMSAVIVELAALWIISLYAYATLPDEVVTNFDASGKPISYGSKSMFLILPFVFSIAPVIILTITGLRFTLINKYPYLLSLPAFYTHLYELPENLRAVWVNKYFELVLALGAAISLYLLFLLVAIYRGTLEGQLPTWFLPVVIASPILLIIPFLYALNLLSQRMKSKLSA